MKDIRIWQCILTNRAVDSARMDLAIRTGKAAARLEQAATAIENEDIPLVTAQIPTVSESMISDINSIMNGDSSRMFMFSFVNNKIVYIDKSNIEKGDIKELR